MPTGWSSVQYWAPESWLLPGIQGDLTVNMSAQNCREYYRTCQHKIEENITEHVSTKLRRISQNMSAQNWGEYYGTCQHKTAPNSTEQSSTAKKLQKMSVQNITTYDMAGKRSFVACMFKSLNLRYQMTRTWQSDLLFCHMFAIPSPLTMCRGAPNSSRIWSTASWKNKQKRQPGFMAGKQLGIVNFSKASNGPPVCISRFILTCKSVCRSIFLKMQGTLLTLLTLLTLHNIVTC